MNRPVKSIRRQRGAVAVIVAIVIGLLILTIGLVVDLGFLYTRKTELQNAADAAALAGAKELKGTAAGIIAAKDQAIDLAKANGVDFGGNPVVITPDEIEFGPGPDGPWSDFATSSASDAAAADKRFIKVDTSGIGLGTVQTWFARVSQWGFGSIESTTTFGRAVAGPNIVDMAPIAICALDGSTAAPCNTTNCGYELGKSYRLKDGTNPISPGDFIWINPVTTSAGECSGTTGTDFMRPFACQGKIVANVAAASQVVSKTGFAGLTSLDSRFNDYPPQGQCDPTTSPPDTNIKKYYYDDTAVAGWMSPAPTNYVSPLFFAPGPPADDGKCKNNECQASRLKDGVADNGGVVWSFVRPENSDIPADTTGTPDVGRNPTANYPTTGTPYRPTTPPSSDTDYFAHPTVNTGKPGRRILTLAIVKCPAEGGNCKSVNVITRGQFLMQRPARGGPGYDSNLYLEFGGLIGVAGITAEYKLYR